MLRFDLRSLILYIFVVIIQISRICFFRKETSSRYITSINWTLIK